MRAVILVVALSVLATGTPACSAPVPVSTIAQAKSYADGTEITITGKLVSGRTWSAYWITEDSRSCGIRIVSALFPPVGTRMTLTGTISTTEGERRITPTSETAGSLSTVPRPLGFRLDDLGGAPLNAYTPGVHQGTGPNNVGLFVRVCGRVTAVSADYYYIDDGSRIVDGTTTGASPNIGVRVLTPPGSIALNDFVTATGAVSSFLGPSSRIQRAILPTTGYPDVGSITGRVTDSSGANLVGALVSTSPGSYSATTDSSGNYTITGVPTGIYSVTAAKSGYNSQTQTGRVVSYNQSTSVNFTLVSSIVDLITNGGFENGFAPSGGNYVGVGWTSFVSSGYSPSWQDGTDQKKAGSHSQRIVLPQPSDQKFAGVYQRLSTVPGNQYTLTAWEYASMAEAYSGEHLVCKLGYDLSGGTNFTSASVNWQEFNAAKNAWVSLTRTFTATGNYTTIYLEAWRKWASGGSGTVWFDSVSCVGPSGPQNGSISGTVKDTSGVGINGAIVSTNVGGYSATSGTGGTYTISNVAVGSYSVTAAKAGYNPQTLSGVAVSGGQTATANFILSAATGSGSITGTVIAPNGSGLAGATTSLSPGGQSVTTSANGSYTFTSVAAGSYSVTASRSGYQSHTYASQAVNNGQITRLNFTLPYSHSKVGFHIVIGARNGYGTFLQQTANCGKPVAIIKCVDDMSPAVEAKSYSQATLTVGRYIDCGGSNMENFGGWGIPAQAVADQVYPCLKARWQQHPEIDVWELCNEWDSDYAYQADYYIAMMDKAEADGFRLALWSSSVGTPSETVYPEVARACARAKQSGNHLLALHEYALYGEPALLQNASTSLVTRYRQLHNYLKQHNADIPIIITECAQNAAYQFVGDELFVQDFGWYDSQLRQDSYVLGVTAWILGNWGNANCMSALDDMANYICTH